MKTRPSILVLDDDDLSLGALRLALEGEYEVRCFAEPSAAEAFLETRDADLALLDLNLSSTSGLDVLRRWRHRFPDLEIVFCSGETSVARAIQCLREGASDYVVKPFDRDDLRLILKRALEKSGLKRRVERLSPMVLPHPVEFIGESPAVRDLLDKVKRLQGQPHLSVLLLGESGTGKEVIARLFHQQEADAQRPFVVVNMPAIPPTLMEAELFGVSKGAYTDAKVARAGKFELAEGGDVFLDEIGELPAEAQAKLLRTLQEKTVERIGSGRGRRIEFRVLSATNQPLGDLVEAGRFREDLLYRLSDVVLCLPPLRERREDIPRLARHFLEKHAIGEPPELTARALADLTGYSWPGNVRQLESTVKRALAFHRGPRLERMECFDPGAWRPGREEKPRIGLEPALASTERKLILEALERHGGDRAAALSELGLSRATFYRRVQQLGIPLK